MASNSQVSLASETHIVTVVSETIPEPESSKTKNKNKKELNENSEPEQGDPFLVSDLGDDPSNPMNMSRLRRWYITVVTGLLVLNATFASSVPSGVLPALMEEFTFSQEVGALVVSLFVAGYVVGPLLWGPLSEEFGRKPIFVICFFVYTMFQIGMAFAQNTATLLVLRFIGGIFAACPLANSGAVISDIWDAKTRGKAMALFTAAPFAGPSLGPVVGGFIFVSGTSWRWVFWVLTMFSGFCLALIVFTVPETYKPILLVRLAQKKRKETGDDRYYAPFERIEKTLNQQIEAILGRPFKLLFQEPMMLAATLYMSFVYGCLYLLFEAYPIVFSEGHGFNAGISGLMFLPILAGGLFAVALSFFTFNPRYERQIIQYAPHPVPPERRLEMAMIAAPLFAIAFFWFGWTSYPSISFWAPMMSGAFMGFSILWIFLSLFNYIIDTYLAMAASALSASTVVRSLFGAGFPLFASQMFDRLNPRWASTLLGCLALLMTPIPFVFVKFGAKLRAKSKFSMTPAPQLPKVLSRPSSMA
ncbi:MFS general substrate transporter [Dendrothele bispora CBS 962.96]|uniref:MFS general substrate transporter n=1 Tax=Dendrothele bispora (strain CBS 962.96) TaxID=1314807 RepID=A0A4S8MWE2_DENBC|nr:MFS general substrate transporter [Dendrothele bispora CBS 962.96]